MNSAYLDVGAGGEPGLVSQHLVYVVKQAKTRWSRFQTLQPQRVPAGPQELGRVQAHQVAAVITGRRLQRNVQRGSFKRTEQLKRSTSSISSQVTHHDGDVMAVRQRQGAVHVQDVVLCAQEALQILGVGRHLLRHGVHAPPADQCLHKQQGHALLLAVHHPLHKPEQTDDRLVCGRETVEQRTFHPLLQKNEAEEVTMKQNPIRRICFSHC